jgi:hypothetical protein
MRTIPPPIRSVELRDRLSELLKAALRTEKAGTPLYLLRSFRDMVIRQGQAEVSRDELVKRAERTFGEVGIRMTAVEAIDELLAARLLRALAQESGRAQLAPGETLQAELFAATDRIDVYCLVLEQVSRRRSRADGPVERALEEAAYLFNEGLFFEVHEVLEAVWLTQGEGIRLLLQGLIQIAVGFHHLENRNLRGALSLLEEGIGKVKEYNLDQSRLELDQFVAQIEHARRSIESLGEAAFDLFDRRMIPNMPLIGVCSRT